MTYGTIKTHLITRFNIDLRQGFWYRFLVDAKVYEVEKKIKERGKNAKEVIESEYGIKL